MSEKRETILRLLQDETGRILDVKVEQQPVPVPEYVFELQSTGYDPQVDRGVVTALAIGNVISYKTIGDDETIIPVPFSVNGKTVTPNAIGEAHYSVTFDTADMEPDPEHPTVYEFDVHIVQEETGETITLPYEVSTTPYLRTSGHSARVSYRGEEQTLDIVLRSAFYDDLVLSYDSKETAAWLHASIVGKQLHITCEENRSVKERSGDVILSLSGDSKTNWSVRVTQEAGEVKYMIRPSCTDAHLSDDKTRRLVRLRMTVQMADQHTGKFIDTDVPWTVTGSDDRVVVESVDEAKRELLLSLDAADTLETPVTVTLHLEDGSDITMEYPLFKEDLTPSDK